MSCGHRMCDLCLRKACNSPGIGFQLTMFGNIMACSDCIRRAVHSAYEFVYSWGGIVEKECGGIKPGPGSGQKDGQ